MKVKIRYNLKDKKSDIIFEGNQKSLERFVREINSLDGCSIEDIVKV